MVEASGSWLPQQHSHWESSTFRNCMISPIDNRQHEFLPASLNPCRVSANLGLNGFESNHLTGKSMPYSQNPFPTSNRYLEEQSQQTFLFPGRVDEREKPLTFEAQPSPQQKRFLIFDQSGNETRLIFSSLCHPQVQNPITAQTKHPSWNPRDAPAGESFGAYKYLAERQPGKVERPCLKKPVTYEESGENEIVEEGSEMREDSEEIDALLYSDDDNDNDNDDDDDEEEEEASTGHSPLARGGDCDKQEEQDHDEVCSLDRSSKRRKALDGGYNSKSLMDTKIMGNLSLSYENVDGFGEGVSATTGSKRPRKDKIRDTLKVLESIVPGVKSKDPLVILEEAISYLKCLKYNAETMVAEEDPDSSSCYGPLF